MVEGEYLYGIVEGAGRPGLEAVGLGERPVYLIPCRGVAAVASASPVRPYPADARNATRHAAVVEKAMRSGPVLPVRFGTVLRGRERVMALLDAHHDAYLEALQRLRGKVEMAVKVLWEPERAGGEVRPPEGDEPRLKSGDPLQAPGSTYLLRKLQDHRMAEAARERGERWIGRIDGALRPLAVDGVLRRFPTPRLLLDAAYLVAAGSERALQETVARLDGEMAGLRFLVTGPWPPYSFVPGPDPKAG